MGRAVGIRFAMDTNIVISTCNKVPSEFRSDCFYGFGQYLGQNFYNNMDAATSGCNNIPIEFRDKCFSGLGNLIGISFGGDIDSAVSACNNTPLEFKANCFSGLRFAIDQFWGEDTISAISACNRIPVRYNHFCLLDLSFKAGYNGDASLCEQFKKPYDTLCILGFGKRLGEESPKELEKCHIISYRDERTWCYRGFGRGLIDQYSNNVSSALDICDSLGEEDMPDCFKGVVEGVGNLFSGDNLYTVLNGCNALDMFSSYCYERIGKAAVTNLYIYDFSKAVNICDTIKKDFKEYCFEGIGEGLGETFLANSSFALMKCEELSHPYDINCSQGLDETIKFYNTSS